MNFKVRKVRNIVYRHILPGMDVQTNKDSDYRGDEDMILMNLSDDAFVIRDIERRCKMIISKYEKSSLINVENLIKLEHDVRGFVYTGKN